jgi:hypothetical protein
MTRRRESCVPSHLRSPPVLIARGHPYDVSLLSNSQHELIHDVLQGSLMCYRAPHPAMSTSPTPFTVAIPDAALADLRARLALTRFPAELVGAGSARGPPRADMERLVARWRDGYDWRRREAEINALPMYTLPVEVRGFGALGVHFVHARSKVAGAVPLLYLHGWPGHFLEVERMLPLLLDGADEGTPSFDVVAPSLPGFGFSQDPGRVGFGLDQFAEVRERVCAGATKC